MPDTDPPTLVLWTRRDCHLCEVAKEELHALRRRVAFHVEERDVDDRPDWADRYGDQVPVGMVDGRKVFKYRVEPERLARALRRRGAPSQERGGIDDAEDTPRPG